MSQTLSTEKKKLIMQYSGVYSTGRKTNVTKGWTISLGALGIFLLDSLGCPECVGYKWDDNLNNIFFAEYLRAFGLILSKSHHTFGDCIYSEFWCNQKVP